MIAYLVVGIEIYVLLSSEILRKLTGTQKVDKHMDSATQILDIAERRMRQAGYNAVSYRDIAAEMGIKSASLHYHFPKKVDLGTALVRRYASAFATALNTATEGMTNPENRSEDVV